MWFYSLDYALRFFQTTQRAIKTADVAVKMMTVQGIFDSRGGNPVFGSPGTFPVFGRLGTLL